MSQDKLSEFVASQATELGVPGVAVGVLLDGQEIYASHGVTSLANPLPIDEKTLFPLASVSKTFTATALMCLVAQGKVDLDAPVRRYVPELKLADEQAAAQITVLNLLNHTAGLDWNLIDDGEGDRSLAGLVAKLPRLPLIAPPGSAPRTARPATTWPAGSSRRSPGSPSSRPWPHSSWSRWAWRTPCTDWRR